MIEKIDPNQIQDFPAQSPPKHPDAAKNPSDSPADVSLQVNCTRLINKALEIPQVDSEAVKTTRELLLCGKLESPENIRAAAEDILNYGV